MALTSSGWNSISAVVLKVMFAGFEHVNRLQSVIHPCYAQSRHSGPKLIYAQTKLDHSCPLFNLCLQWSGPPSPRLGTLSHFGVMFQKLPWLVMTYRRRPRIELFSPWGCWGKGPGIGWNWLPWNFLCTCVCVCVSVLVFFCLSV